MTARITLAGLAVVSAVVNVPSVGPWFADVVLEGAAELSGAADLVLGETLTLSGTVRARSAGVFAEQRSVRLVAGADGWGTLLEPRGYHNDGAGVSARTVATDAAEAAGETLGDFAPSSQAVGRDYVRASGPASIALADAAGLAAWWVGFDGVTRVGARTASTPAAGSYELLEYDPLQRVAVLAMSDLASVGIGSQLAADARMPEAQTVREMRIEVGGDSVQVVAWCGGVDGALGRILGGIRAIVDRALAERILVPVRYRVVQMSVDRVDLQAVSPGFPNIGPISMVPGVAGAHAALAGGSIVLVQFVEGDPAQPQITHFAGKDGTGWTPTSITLDASGASASIKLGANATKAPAWVGEVRGELVKIAAALTAAQASPGGGPLTWLPGTDYPVASVPLATALGASKTVCE